MVPRGGVMLGMSRTVRNDSLIEFEHVRIERRGADLYYVASPARQATAEFKATAMTDSSITFENPAHDFPRKIVYRRQGADSLVASIEGPRGGTTRTIAFPYRRVGCPSGLRGRDEAGAMAMATDLPAIFPRVPAPRLRAPVGRVTREAASERLPTAHRISAAHE